MTDPDMINDGHLHLGMTVRDPARRPDERALLAEMDTHGVARAAVITPATCGWDNGLTVAAVQAHPGRFVGVARIDMDRASAPRECAGLLDQGLHGIRIDVRGSGEVLDTVTTAEVLAVLHERHAVLDLHASADEMTPVARIAERHQGLTILLDHGGRPTPVDLDRPSGSALGALLRQLPDAFQFQAGTALVVGAEALDQRADELLPALVRRVIGEGCPGSVEILAIHDVEEISATSPDRPVGDPEPVEGLDQVGRDAAGVGP